MILARRALSAFAAFILLGFAACSPASNNNTATANSNAARPASSPAAATKSKSKPGTGSLDVQSLPDGAGITLLATTEDSAAAPQSYGATPAMINDLKPGKYTVQLSKPGYKDFQQEIEIKADDTARVKARLKK